ncbi:hypothetical protein AB0B54_19240 [Microbispora bryophytorum]|uniref:hypothetical protein n=1 Tax=Microbispora bryophytorum TaxID=1460882 RepID=UPI00341004E8
MAWLSREHPRLVPRYLELYGRGAYAPKAYQERIGQAVRALAREHGIGRSAPPGTRAGQRPGERPAPPPAPAAAPEQLTLL